MIIITKIIKATIESNKELQILEELLYFIVFVEFYQTVDLLTFTLGNCLVILSEFEGYSRLYTFCPLMFKIY